MTTDKTPYVMAWASANPAPRFATKVRLESSRAGPRDEHVVIHSEPSDLG